MGPKLKTAVYEARLRTLSGLTSTAAARQLGIGYRPTRQMAKELGIQFAQGTGAYQRPTTILTQDIKKLHERELAMDPVERWG